MWPSRTRFPKLSGEQVERKRELPGETGTKARRDCGQLSPGEAGHGDNRSP